MPADHGMHRLGGPTSHDRADRRTGQSRKSTAANTGLRPPTPSPGTGVFTTPEPETGVPAEPGTSLPFPEPSTGQSPPTQQNALQAVVDRIATVAATAGMRGVTAAVVTPQGSWTGAAGVDGDGQPLDPNAMMGIGAITQIITAAQVLALHTSGRVDLDPPASKHVQHPALEIDPTVRQVLSHTSGIPDYVIPEFLTAVTTDPTRSWTAADVLQYTPDGLATPGPPFRYSNSDYVLLGLLIEGITGQSYAAAASHGVLDGTRPRIAPMFADEEKADAGRSCQSRHRRRLMMITTVANRAAQTASDRPRMSPPHSLSGQSSTGLSWVRTHTIRAALSSP